MPASVVQGPKTRVAAADFPPGLASRPRPVESCIRTGFSGCTPGKSRWFPAKMSYTPYGEQVAGPSARFTFTGLANENLGGATDSMLAATYRSYRPGLGRWNQRDPAGAVDGPNAFLYSRNNPLGRLDPSGLASLTAGGGEIATQRVISGSLEVVGSVLEVIDLSLAIDLSSTSNHPFYGQVRPFPNSQIGLGLRVEVDTCTPGARVEVMQRLIRGSQRGRGLAGVDADWMPGRVWVDLPGFDLSGRGRVDPTQMLAALPEGVVQEGLFETTFRVNGANSLLLQWSSKLEKLGGGLGLRGTVDVSGGPLGLGLTPLR